MSLLARYQSAYLAAQEEEMSLQDYLELCKADKMAYASVAERMLMAIGEPELVDTRLDPRLSRIFANKMLRIYPAFKEFYGMEEVIEHVVSYFRHAAQGLEEKKQILYLLGPVGGGKSSLAERLKLLIEKVPFYAIKDSPVHESPLSLFNVNEDGHILEQDYGIGRRYLGGIMSPWAVKRLREYGGDISRFRVVKMRPSVLSQIAVSKTEPGDENNQDISSLVGKVDIRKLEHYSQNDPDAYSYSGGLCLANRGVLEFVEMFKAPIKVLHPLLTATQEQNYKGTEGFGAIPFDGLVLAHSNEAEWMPSLPRVPFQHSAKASLPYRCCGLQVHAGFGNAWLNNNFNKKVLEKLQEIDQAQQGTEPLRFWITGAAAAAAISLHGGSQTVGAPALTWVFVGAWPVAAGHAGHSLGGALAVLASDEVAKAFPDSKITCYTWGAPRASCLSVNCCGLGAACFACCAEEPAMPEQLPGSFRSAAASRSLLRAGLMRVPAAC